MGLSCLVFEMTTGRTDGQTLATDAHLAIKAYHIGVTSYGTLGARAPPRLGACAFGNFYLQCIESLVHGHWAVVYILVVNATHFHTECCIPSQFTFQCIIFTYKFLWFLPDLVNTRTPCPSGDATAGPAKIWYCFKHGSVTVWQQITNWFWGHVV